MFAPLSLLFFAFLPLQPAMAKIEITDVFFRASPWSFNQPLLVTDESTGGGNTYTCKVNGKPVRLLFQPSNLRPPLAPGSVVLGVIRIEADEEFITGTGWDMTLSLRFKIEGVLTERLTIPIQTWESYQKVGVPCCTDGTGIAFPTGHYLDLQQHNGDPQLIPVLATLSRSRTVGELRRTTNKNRRTVQTRNRAER